jgi:hypothetical protein
MHTEAGNTANDPSCPGAHAAISAAAQTVLVALMDSDVFRLDVTSEVLPGVERHFESFSAAEREASLSRIFAGVHFSTTNTPARHSVARWAGLAVDHSLREQKCEERAAAIRNCRLLMYP